MIKQRALSREFTFLMIFGEIFYGAFLLFTLAIYWLAPHRFRMIIVAISGLLFYWYYAGVYVILLALLTVGSWLILFSRPITNASAVTTSLVNLDGTSSPDEYAPTSLNRSARLAAWLCIVFFVAVLAFFKYWSFLLDIVVDEPVQRIVAPLAISFFIFEFIHVTAEYLKGNIQKAPIDEYLAFIFFFPTMIAGPIKRYDQFDDQFKQARLNSKNLLEGLFRILLGLLKKAVIADNLNTLIQEIGSPQRTQNVALLSGAIFLYGFRIYLDFSGYSDIAIGSARLFGIRVPENFLYPYRQSNISAFWRNWHISLYSWLIDYIYIPLGGSRAGFKRALFNILVVMLVSGLWHGAAWNFVLWGLWHGILLMIHKLYSDLLKPRLNQRLVNSRLSWVLSYFVTMGAVWFGWMLFMWPISDVNKYLFLVWEKLT